MSDTDNETNNGEKRVRAALDAKRLNYFAYDPDKLVIIGLDTKDGPEHFLWDERATLPVDEKLARNIMVNGVIEAVIVAKDGDRVLVVAGRQRVKSARRANELLRAEGKMEIQVPVCPRRGEDAALFGVFVSENEQRTNDTPLVKAAKAQRMLNMGVPESEVIVQFGITMTTLGYWQKLLELSPKVRNAVDNEQLTAAAAMALHGLSREEQNTKLEALVAAAPAGKKVSAKKARQARGGTTAPGKREISRVAEKLKHPHSCLLAWVLGEMSQKELLNEAPVFEKAFECPEEKPKAKSKGKK